MSIRDVWCGARSQLHKLTWATAVLSAIWILPIAVRKEFSIDEFQYAHAAWLVNGGSIPYKDFFEHHAPLLYQIHSVFYGLSDSAGDLLLVSRVMMWVVLCVTLAAAAVLNSGRGRLTAALTVILIATTPDFVRFAVEIRPDALATCLFLLTLASLQSKREHSLLLSGFLWVATFWASQKAAYYASLVPLVLLLDSVWDESVAPRGRRVTEFALGACAAIGLIAGYLTITGSWIDWFRWCVAWTVVHQRDYPGFPFTEYLLPVVSRQPWLLILGGAGWLASARESGHHRNELLLTIAWPTTLVSFVLQKAAFPYSLLPFLAITAILAARGFGTLASRASRPARLSYGALLLTLLALQALRLVHVARETNADQLNVLNNIAELTDADDCVYDNAGAYVNRPHAHFFFYTDALLRLTRGPELDREIPDALLRGGCAVRLEDLRTATLPPRVRAFLTTHYQPWNGDIYVWGRSYDVPADGRLHSEFLAVEDGEYFVEPSTAWSAVTIGGQLVPPSSSISLTRGTHDLRYVGRGPLRLFVLWLPRNQQRWIPRPGHPTFSRLF